MKTKSHSTILRKIREIRHGRTPRILDLFAGCGGLSLGFHAAGFDISASVELDPIAALTHATNFFGNDFGIKFAQHATPRDITTTHPSQLIAELGISRAVENAVDVIVGGPPCQAFARVGRSKLREIARHPAAFLRDPRSNLYLRFLAYVRQMMPVVVLMENVPDCLNFGGHNVAEEVCEALEDIGYVCRYTMLNCVFYGVPQMRERMFLLGYHEALETEVSFPAPTHWIELPGGYHGSRCVALGSISKTNGNGKHKPSEYESNRYVTPPPKTGHVKRAVSAKEALSDLPPITAHLNGGLRRGARRFDQLVGYCREVRPSSYASLMRKWPGYESSNGIWDHVIRYLPRDYETFARMQPGDQYPEARIHAIARFQERIAALQEQGIIVREGSTRYREEWDKIVPPYDHTKFPNKWRKMEADLPARTLMAHISKDTYSHIHYDDAQARTISVREAARLQSFPDGFVFKGTMNSAFRQIGNAVPPLMGVVLGAEVIRTLKG